MRLHILLMMVTTALFANVDIAQSEVLDLKSAIEIVKQNNLEIEVASFDERIATEDISIIKGKSFGSLSLTQEAARSNDAGNAFGFKLASREADFGDFGADEFMNNMGLCQGGEMSACGNLYTKPPKNLNRPEYQNFHQSKLTYQVPLFTGGMLSSYEDVTSAIKKIRSLEKDEMINEKIYQTTKSFHDMALLNSSIENLNIILKNIEKLESTTQAMIEEGYAKKVDLLEVKAKKANVQRLVNEMESNKALLYHFLSFLLNRDVKEIKAQNTDAQISFENSNTLIVNNLDIQKATQGLIVREEMVDVANASLMPTVGAFAEASTADDKIFNDMSDHKGYTVGARLTWNLFNGGSDVAAIEKARVEELKMKTQLELAKKGTALKLDEIRTQIKKYDYQIDSLANELELSSEIYANYEGRYKEKLVSMNDVIIKQSQQIEKILELAHVKNLRNERVFAYKKLINGEMQ
jgi:outer membrane protein